jgi:integrase
VKLLAESTSRIRVVSVEEELAYLQAASQPLRDIGKVMLETGLRPEEVFRVQPAIIDFNRSTILIPFGKTKAARSASLNRSFFLGLGGVYRRNPRRRRRRTHDPQSLLKAESVTNHVDEYRR